MGRRGCGGATGTVVAAAMGSVAAGTVATAGQQRGEDQSKHRRRES